MSGSFEENIILNNLFDEEKYDIIIEATNLDDFLKTSENGHD